MLTGDKDQISVEDLSEEELRDILEEAVDHKTPVSKKCALVQRLSEETSKDESLESCLPSSSKYNSFVSSPISFAIPNKFTGRKSRHLKSELKSNKNVHSSQSLQDLVNLTTNSDQELNTYRNCGRNSIINKKLTKTSRANSFTTSHTASSTVENSSNNKIDFDFETDPVERSSSSLSNMNSTKNKNKNKCKQMSNISSSRLATRSLSEDMSAIPNNANILTNSACDVDSEFCEPSASSISSTSSHDNNRISNNSLKSLCDNNGPHQSSNVKMPKDNLPSEIRNEEVTNEVEMQDLRKKVRLVEYTSKDVHNDSEIILSNEEAWLLPERQNCVDSVVEFSHSLKSRGPMNTAFAERVINNSVKKLDEFENATTTLSLMSEESKSAQSVIDNESKKILVATDNAALPYSSEKEGICYTGYDPNYLCYGPRNNARTDGLKKKKKPEEPKLFAHEIEGHIGDKDVDYLVKYVAGNDTQDGVLPTNSIGITNSKCLTTENKISSSSTMKDSVNKKKDKNPNHNPTNIRRKANGPGNSSHIDSCERNITSNKDIPSSPSSPKYDDTIETDIAQNSNTTSTNEIVDKNLASPNSSSQISETGSETSTCAEPPTKISSTPDHNISLITKHAVLSDEEQVYMYSDCEIQDGGFQLQKKHYRRRKSDSLKSGHKRHQFDKSYPSGASSSSTTPSLPSSISYSATVSAAAATARGYDSECDYEYCAERKKQEHLRLHKSASSMLQMPLEQNSEPDNSDVDSSCSLPISRRNVIPPCSQQSRTSPSSISSTPKASYADIAKMSVIVNIGSTFPTPNNPKINTANICNQTKLNEAISSDVSKKNVSKVEETAEQSSVFNENEIKMLETDTKAIETKDDAEITKDVVEISFVDVRNTCTNQQPIMKKSKSIPESSSPKVNYTHSDITSGWKNQLSTSSLPPVIMYDCNSSTDDVGSNVTFGFFDDVIEDIENLQNNSMNEKTSENDLTINSPNLKQDETISQIQTSPTDEIIRRLNADLASFIVDKKTFNYNEIMKYIRNAWEKVIKEDRNSKSVKNSNIGNKEGIYHRLNNS